MFRMSGAGADGVGAPPCSGDPRGGGRPRRLMRTLVGSICLALSGVPLAAVPIAPAVGAVTDNDTSFEVDAGDLRFILKQIRISEAHENDGNLLCEREDDTSGTCVPHPLLPWGLRTVDGSYNNLMPGQSGFGAADQPFPRLMPEYLREGEAAPPGAPPQPNTDTTAMCTDPAASCYAQTEGFVYDSEPRMISNLIVDQTTSNPAAVAAASAVPGSAIDDVSGRIFIPNESPDVGLSAPFNQWFTLFGQFFDHGLDLVNKGGNGTVIVPLQPDDPLYDKVPPNMRFMALTRATVVGTGPDGSRLHNNQTTPFVDQNQTYSSHPAFQVFLREYQLVNQRPEDTGRLLEGDGGGLATWAEVKAAAASNLGIALSDDDVLDGPMIVTDLYGQFTPGPNGLPQLMTATGPVEGNLAVPVSPSAVGALRTGHAFLVDIAHNAVPTAAGPDADSESNDPHAPRPGGTYDDELLDAHFIAGDGRANENIGLTAVHHVFHAEHNRLRDAIDATIQATPSLKAGYEDGGWGYGARLFQAARYVTEMEYQHLVFEEFARKIQPTIDAAPFNESTYHNTINSALPAEFAHVVYRFGHSILTDKIHRRGFGTEDVSLFDGFLNPHAFKAGGITADQAAGSIINGMSSQTGNGIDEFVDDTLRNQLLGLPLDLPTINIARARDAGVPPLQAVRAQFYSETSDPSLKPYADWTDFGNALKNPESLVNFVAAYGTHPTLTSETTIAGKRAAAQALVDAGDPFLDLPASESGLDGVDFWVGGLAEAGMPFGGMLGTTFNQVFEQSLENLQNGDRFYYLNRNIGLNLFHQLEANSFSALVQRTTAASEVPTDIFASQDGVVYDIEVIKPMVEAGGVLPDGLTQMQDGTYRYVGEEHIQMHGLRSDADRLRSDEGDDALWGYAGADRIEGGAGNDAIVGGGHDDILTDLFGDDNIKAGKGDDAVHAGPGADLIHGGAGSDFIVHGQDETQTFAGQGNDFVLGGGAHDIFAGNEGDDWMEGAGGSDLVQGDNSNGFQDDPFGGNDVMIGGPGNDDLDSEGGDDIMVTDPGTDRHEGMLGFDWVTHLRDPNPAKADMDNTIFQPPSVQNMRDRYDLVEGLSGWDHDDVLRGVDRADVPPTMAAEDCAALSLPAQCTGHELTEAHLDLIAGLRDLLGSHTAPFLSNNTANDIIIGGAGSDIIEGRGGNDFIDGTAWLNVQLTVAGTRYDRLRDIRSGVFADPQTVNPADIGIVREIVVPADDGVNTAVYSDVLANYEVTDNGDGTVTVSHLGGAGADGTDVIRNIDRLLFADGDIAVSDALPNTAASGTLLLSTNTPVEGVPLTVDASGLVDPDGINLSTLVLTWEAGSANGGFAPVGEGVEYTPTQADVGKQLRVVATFTDNDGVNEQVISDWTTGTVVDDPALGNPAPNPNPGPNPDPNPVPNPVPNPAPNPNPNPAPNPNAPATGVLPLTMTATGRAMRVSTTGIADPDGLGELAIQWQKSDRSGGFVDIVGQTGQRLRLSDAVRGLQVRVMVSFTDQADNQETLVSDPYRVPKVRPGSPMIRSVIHGLPGGKITARIAWAKPEVTGGARITGYQVKTWRLAKDGSVIGRKAMTVPAATRAKTLRFNHRGAYKVRIRAINKIGMSNVVSRKVIAR